MPVIILPMHQDDIDAVAKIHLQEFLDQENSLHWISCNFASFPRVMIYVARDEQDNIIGYVQWCYKNGFRKNAVIELEQIVVAKTWQRQGIATKLIELSLDSIKHSLDDSKAKLKTIVISVEADNCKAQLLYKKILKAEVVATIGKLYSSDEIIMKAAGL